MNFARLHDAMAGYVARGEIPQLVRAVGQHADSQVDAVGTPLTFTWGFGTPFVDPDT